MVVSRSRSKKRPRFFTSLKSSMQIDRDTYRLAGASLYECRPAGRVHSDACKCTRDQRSSQPGRTVISTSAAVFCWSSRGFFCAEHGSCEAEDGAMAECRECPKVAEARGIGCSLPCTTHECTGTARAVAGAGQRAGAAA
jgi:hypothetical protein